MPFNHIHKVQTTIVALLIKKNYVANVLLTTFFLIKKNSVANVFVYP